MQTQFAGQTIINKSNIPPSDAFMIYGMFAIGARFSRATHFENVAPTERGEEFVNRATTIKDAIIKTIQVPSLEFVKGCVMLAFYFFTAGQIGQGSVLTSVCVRFAYDLSLNVIDEDLIDDNGDLNDPVSEPSSDACIKREELRRLWWSIWELDTFVSTLSRQPYGIERGQIKVLLPISDHNWFCRIPTRSAFIKHQPEVAWKSLKFCPNQPARAWFLIANYLLSCISFGARQRSRTSTTTKDTMETALCNFKLSLPTSFQLGSLFFDKTNFEEVNWIVSTHLMIIAYTSTILSSLV